MLLQYRHFQSSTKLNTDKTKNWKNEKLVDKSNESQNVFVPIFRTQQSQQWFLTIICIQSCLRCALFFLLPAITHNCNDVSPLYVDHRFYAILEISAVFLFQFAFSCLAYQFLLFYYSIVVKSFSSKKKKNLSSLLHTYNVFVTCNTKILPCQQKKIKKNGNTYFFYVTFPRGQENENHNKWLTLHSYVNQQIKCHSIAIYLLNIVSSIVVILYLSLESIGKSLYGHRSEAIFRRVPVLSFVISCLLLACIYGRFVIPVFLIYRRIMKQQQQNDQAKAVMMMMGNYYCQQQQQQQRNNLLPSRTTSKSNSKYKRDKAMKSKRIDDHNGSTVGLIYPSITCVVLPNKLKDDTPTYCEPPSLPVSTSTAPTSSQTPSPRSFCHSSTDPSQCQSKEEKDLDVESNAKLLKITETRKKKR
ncbi:hypothetical protein RFI_05022, partial [Reticulomyxa filosa]